MTPTNGTFVQCSECGANFYPSILSYAYVCGNGHGVAARDILLEADETAVIRKDSTGRPALAYVTADESDES